MIETIAWMKQARCNGLEWFVEEGRLHDKREVCKECPVKENCLTYALKLEDVSPVVYGGKTGNQRSVLL